MRYFGVGVVMIVLSIPASGELVGPGLLAAGGLCFVADAITRLTEELRRQHDERLRRETMRNRGHSQSKDDWADEQLDAVVREQLGIGAD